MRFSIHLEKKRFKAPSLLMVFSSIIPGYLDPPNWHHQQQSSHRQPQQGDGRGQNPQLLPPLPEGGSGASDTIRTPGSMSDRARQAKMPQPETALKCPRCESTNTKFCYFNNYSLTQPRHFCKTCRRYWTRGGALRSVPVGGGCRRNKRSKRSKSPASASPSDHNQQHRVAGNNNSSSSTVSNSNSCSTNNDNITGGHLALPPLPHHQLPFFPALHHLNDYGSSAAGGLNFGSINIQPAGLEFHNQASNGIGQWRSSLQQHQMQQSIPFLANLEAPTNHGLYAFEGNHQNNVQILSKPLESCIGAAQTASVKMEESQALNLSRNFLGSLGNDQHQQYWPGNNSSITTNGGIVNAWTDLSGFTSSTSHLL